MGPRHPHPLPASWRGIIPFPKEAPVSTLDSSFPFVFESIFRISGISKIALKWAFGIQGFYPSVVVQD